MTAPDPLREDEVREVAKAMAPVNWLPFDPSLHGSPVNREAAQVRWLSHARAAILRLDQVREGRR